MELVVWGNRSKRSVRKNPLFLFFLLVLILVVTSISGEAVRFSDPNLEAAVREALEKESGTSDINYS